jgi:hypothetical protein
MEKEKFTNGVYRTTKAGIHESICDNALQAALTESQSHIGTCKGYFETAVPLTCYESAV